MPSLSNRWRQATHTGYDLAQAAVSSPKSARAARRNIRHAVGLTLLFNLAILCCLVTWTLWPLAIALLFFLSAVQRSALRARAQSTHIPTRFRLGLMHQLAQIPIFIGQLNYRLTPRRPKSR